MTIKEKVIKELDKKEFPDLKLLFSEDVLDISLEILKDFLEEERKMFSDFLLKDNSEINFDSFEEDTNLDYFWSLLNHLDNVDSSEKTRNIIEEFRPLLQDFSNEVAYSKEYFEKLVYVFENTNLNNEEKRILEKRIKAFKDRWIDLEKEKQDRLKFLNKELSNLSDKFSNNIVDEEKDYEYLITDFEIIKNLPSDVLEIAKKAWEEKGGYLFDSDPSSYTAIMKYCSDPETREEFEKSRNARCSNWKYDNREIVLSLLNLKDEKAKLLWYKNYAELSLKDKMADSPEQVFSLINDISQKAKTKSEKDLDEIKQYFSLNYINSYDVAYYSTILKEEKYSLDEKEIKKYFEFENTLSYLFSFIEEFYWLEIKELKNESYNENVRIYEIYKNGELLSYYFLDPYFRKGKRPWAWADNLREKTRLWVKKVPVVVNVCNFQKSLNGKTTIYMRDAETLFHEFGHAIHEMLSESKYSELSGFWVEWDFVELPSQLLENWVSSKESLKKIAKHVDSWEFISDELIEKMEKLKYFMTGLFLSRQTEFSILDMTIYSQKLPSNIEELDKTMLDIVNQNSYFKRDNDYKMYCSFNHIFWWGYAAGYYSYMWAEMLEADVFSRIKEMWMFSRETWEKLFSTIIWQWTRKKASELFYDFMWRELDNKAFIERYWI